MMTDAALPSPVSARLFYEVVNEVMKPWLERQGIPPQLFFVPRHLLPYKGLYRNLRRTAARNFAKSVCTGMRKKQGKAIERGPARASQRDPRIASDSARGALAFTKISERTG